MLIRERMIWKQFAENRGQWESFSEHGIKPPGSISHRISRLDH